MPEEELVEGKDRTATEIKLAEKAMADRERASAAKMVEPFADRALEILKSNGMLPAPPQKQE